MSSKSSGHPSHSEAGRREIARLIEACADALARVTGVRSVVLMGSAARDELAWTDIEGRPQLFSDLEFLAVTETRLPAAARREAQAALERIASGFGQRSPLFHVDVLFRELERLPKMPPIIFTFELARLGKTLRGKHEKAALPSIDAGNLDRKNTREILMKRLWAMAEQVPEARLQGKPLGPIEARSLGVTLWRNPLDVPTVLLPCAGIMEAGYAQRERIWSRHPELPFRNDLDARFGRDTAVYLRDCLGLRRDCAAAPDLRAAHRDALTLIVGALDWLLKLAEREKRPGSSPQDLEAVIDLLRSDLSIQNEGDLSGEQGIGVASNSSRKSLALDKVWLDDVAQRISDHGGRIFNARPIARGEWLAWLTQGARLSYTSGPRAAMRWWTGRRKGQLCSALIHLHRSLPSVLDDDLDAARPALDQALRACASIYPLEPRLTQAYREASDAATAWLSVRVQVARLFWRVVRLGNPSAWRGIARSIGLPPEWS